MILSLEATNVCNLKCIHCKRDNRGDSTHIPLDLLQCILSEARAYGISFVGFTGGEPTLHPQLDELLDLVARENFKFYIITNGFQFRSRVLPILLKPHIRRHLHHISISLDGATAKTHNANRGPGAFESVLEMIALCKLKDIPFRLITIVNNFNKTELADIALLGSGLDASSHMFGPLHVTPLSVLEGIVPSPDETRNQLSFVARTLTRALRMKVFVAPGAYCSTVLLQCRVFNGKHIHIDTQGHAIFCCTLSQLIDERQPDQLGEEMLADLGREPLRIAIVRQKLLAARLMEERLKASAAGQLSELDYFPCRWCFKRFGKLDWLRDYPDSPWGKDLVNNDVLDQPGIRVY